MDRAALALVQVPDERLPRILFAPQRGTMPGDARTTGGHAGFTRKMHNKAWRAAPAASPAKFWRQMTVRINIESVFEQFDSQLSAALAKAALQTVPGMTTKTAFRL